MMHIPLLLGRGFTDADDERAEPVVIVSKRLADELWPNRDPVGRYLSWPRVRGPRRPAMRVVAVARDTRHRSLTGDPSLVMYVPYTQHPELGPLLLVRGRGRDAIVPPQVVHKFIASVDPTVVPFGDGSLADWVESDATEGHRVASAWVGAFGVIALLLAAIGSYGVAEQGVLQRTRELAVRAAIGAAPATLMAHVLGDGIRLALVGMACGVCGALAAWRLLRGMFTGIEAVDVQGILIACAMLGAVTLIALYLPALRAARLDPVDALRSD
jgi:hypothetical protein